jgi:hypothetical protein
MPDTTSELISRRLDNQRLARPVPADPRAVVSWFGAMQAQDFPGAKWAVGLRAKTLTDAAVQRAYDEGDILRTHVLRPTWHFVAREDIRWLIGLSGPRLLAGMAWRHRQLELDARTVARSRAALARALEGGDLTRGAIADVLRRARIHVTPERLSHLLLIAELEGLVCSGPVRDRRLTHALMDRRAPAVPAMDRDQALARLAGRYFRSHGPATIADFAWWSGLALRDARSAIEMAGGALAGDAVMAGAGRAVTPAGRLRSRGAWLLPNFDEYLVAYKDRRAIVGEGVDPRDTLAHTVLLDGCAIGNWRARRNGAALRIVVAPRRRLTRDDVTRIGRTGRRYAAFLGQPITIEAPHGW